MKKIVGLVFILVFSLSIVTFANLKSSNYSLVYTEVRNEDIVNDDIDRDFKRFKNKQKVKDKYSGPGAIETGGNFVVNADNTEYFSETVAAEQQAGKIETVDPKYGIVFSSKKHFKTNLGEFNLISAEFMPYKFGNHIQYKLEVKFNNIVKAKTSYIVYLKAYDAFGNFVDYNYVPISTARLEQTISLYIYGENERNIARVDFSLDTNGMNALVMAQKYISNTQWDCNDALVKINDPVNGYTDEEKQKFTEKYIMQVNEDIKSKQAIIDRKNEIYEIE